MENVAKSDIFFIITSFSVIIITFLLVFLIVRIISLIKTIKEITDTVKDESINIVSDVRDLRSSLKEKGRGLASLLTLGTITNIVRKTVRSKKNKDNKK